MDALKNRQNWRLEAFQHEEADGTVRERTVIVVSDKVLAHEAFGQAQFKTAFEPLVGRRCVGMFGANPVIVGNPDDSWFGGWSFFDGCWSRTEDAITATSGTGKLYGALLDFSEKQSVKV